MNLPITQQRTLVEETEKCFQAVRVSTLKAAEYLYKCKETEAWESKYSSFGEFVENGLGISQGFAAKLCKSYRYFVVEGGYKPAELADIPTENLYLAINLPGNTEEKVVKAQTLSRSEIKAELASDGKNECAHEEKITICAKCHSRV